MHDDVCGRHAIETVSTLLALCDGNPLSPMDSPHNGPVTRALMFYVMLARQKVKQTDESTVIYLRRQYAHCDVTVVVTLV